MLRRGSCARSWHSRQGFKPMWVPVGIWFKMAAAGRKAEAVVQMGGADASNLPMASS